MIIVIYEEGGIERMRLLVPSAVSYALQIIHWSSDVVASRLIRRLIDLRQYTAGLAKCCPSSISGNTFVVLLLHIITVSDRQLPKKQAPHHTSHHAMIIIIPNFRFLSPTCTVLSPT
jgi:hypothetical protein